MPQYTATATHSDPGLDNRIRAAATTAGLSVSAWLMRLIMAELGGRTNG